MIKAKLFISFTEKFLLSDEVLDRLSVSLWPNPKPEDAYEEIIDGLYKVNEDGHVEEALSDKEKETLQDACRAAYVGGLSPPALGKTTAKEWGKYQDAFSRYEELFGFKLNWSIHASKTYRRHYAHAKQDWVKKDYKNKLRHYFCNGDLELLNADTLQPITDHSWSIDPFQDRVIDINALKRCANELNIEVIEDSQFGELSSPSQLTAENVPITQLQESLKINEVPILENWIMQIQAEAAKRWRQQRELGCNPTKHSLKDELANWCKEQDIKTKTGITPNTDYIYRHVLRNWTPPIN